MRCRSCYLPMRWWSVGLLWWCGLCGSGVTVQEFDGRGRWRQRWDRLTGMVE